MPDLGLCVPTCEDPKSYNRRYFQITATPACNREEAPSSYADLRIEEDHHAEMIIRGLIHSGYLITAKEVRNG